MNARGRLRLLKAEDGQMIIAMALLSLLFVALVAVVLDSGFVYFEKRNLQNAADAAALAGAQSLDGLSSSQTPAETAATNYAGQNISNTNSVSTAVQDQYTEIEVTVRKNATSAFFDFFGTREVSAKARARIAAPLNGGPGVVPMAVANGAIQYGVSITIKTTGGNGNNGNYGWIDLGTGAKDVCDFIRGGSDTSVTDPQPSETGNVSKIKNSDCLPRRMLAAKANNCETYAQTVIDVGGVPTVNPRCDPLGLAQRGTLSAYPDTQPTAIVIFPVVTTFVGCNGSCDLDVVGSGNELRTFAYFLIDRTTTETIGGVGPTCNGGGQCEVTGQFIQGHLAPVSTAFDLPTGTWNPNALVKIVQLVE